MVSYYLVPADRFKGIDPIRPAAQILGAMAICRETGDVFVQVTRARYLHVSDDLGQFDDEMG